MFVALDRDTHPTPSPVAISGADRLRVRRISNDSISSAMSTHHLRFKRLSPGVAPAASKRARLALLSAILSLPAATGLAQASPVSPQTPAQADDIVVLDRLEVTESAVNSSARDYAEAARALRQVAGATAIVDSSVFSKGRLGSTADILAYQPGIFAQEADGGDGIKLSVRGSAINRGAGNSYRSGIYVAFDGLPVTVPGGAPYELQEPFSYSRAEFLLGANGFEYGPRNFGGAINYITPTGYDSPGLTIRGEAGSFDYYKASASYGQVSGPFDYYVSITGAERNGFRYNSQLETLRIASNFGWRINENVENRLYFRYGYTDHYSAGTLSKAQIKANPRQSNVSRANAYDSHREHPGTYWVGDKLTIRPDADSSIELGALWHHYPIEIYGANLSKYFYDTGSLQLKYKRADDIAGHESKTTVGAIASYNFNGWYDRYAWNNATQSYGPAKSQKNDFTGSADNVIFAVNDFAITDQFWATTGVSVVQTIRKNINTIGAYDKYRREENTFAPRFGLRYDFTPDVQVYANIGRTVEPRNDWAGSHDAGGGNFVQRDIRDQTATTWEIGARAKQGIFEGQISYYNASIKNALLSTQIDPLDPSKGTAEINASPTQHQGIEFGLTTTLWQEKDAAAQEHASKIALRQSYTWSDFRYKNDYLYGKNRMPGVPEHYYQAELFFEHSSGFYAGVNVKASTDSYVDYANTYKGDGWVILGFNAGYAPKGGNWRIYLDVRNLTDENYASSISPAFEHRTATQITNGVDPDTINRFSPGDPLSATVGFSYRF